MNKYLLIFIYFFSTSILAMSEDGKRKKAQFEKSKQEISSYLVPQNVIELAYVEAVRKSELRTVLRFYNEYKVPENKWPQFIYKSKDNADSLVEQGEAELMTSFAISEERKNELKYKVRMELGVPLVEAVGDSIFEESGISLDSFKVAISSMLKELETQEKLFLSE